MKSILEYGALAWDAFTSCNKNLGIDHELHDYYSVKNKLGMSTLVNRR